jgi:hypothetical protein
MRSSGSSAILLLPDRNFPKREGGRSVGRLFFYTDRAVERYRQEV